MPADGLPTTGYPPVPELVERAHSLAEKHAFEMSCAPEVGRLLSVLSAASAGPVLEIGTGCGVGSAWILSGLGPGARLITIERDVGLAQAVRNEFRECRALNVVTGEWRSVLSMGPFALAFVDVGEAKDSAADEVVQALTPGGMAVLDDFEPGPLFRGELDERWNRWMNHPLLRTTEIMVTPDSAVLLAVRL